MWKYGVRELMRGEETESLLYVNVYCVYDMEMYG